MLSGGLYDLTYFFLSSQQFSVTFDALLVGHDAGVTSLSWRLSTHQTPTLLSTSTDSSLILWSPSSVISPSNEESSSIWINRQRFGDVGGQRLGGFVGGLWARGGKDVLAWGWAGGWRRWTCIPSMSELADESWSEVEAISGHSGPIKGLDWSPDGNYIISAGYVLSNSLFYFVQILPEVSTKQLEFMHQCARTKVDLHGTKSPGRKYMDTTF